MSSNNEIAMRLWNWVQRGLAMLLLLPAFAIALPVGLLIRFGSRGPLLLCAAREGKDGIPFPMYKLRTMIPDAEAVLKQSLIENQELRREWEEYGRLVNDPRIGGPFARWARRSSVDELPQVLNVVLGHMSLIGPRPLPLDVVARMSRSDRALRQSVLPGLTGLWQVSGRSDLSIDEMGRLDGIYVSQRSVLFDLRILFRTMHAVMSGKGAY